MGEWADGSTGGGRGEAGLGCWCETMRAGTQGLAVGVTLDGGPSVTVCRVDGMLVVARWVVCVGCVACVDGCRCECGYMRG